MDSDDARRARRPGTDSRAQAATVLDRLARRARDSPGDVAFVIEREGIGFAQLFQDAGWVAERLSGLGLARGERVALVLPTGLDLVRAMYGASLAGAVPVVLDPRLPPAALERRLEVVRPSLAIAEDEHAAGRSGLRPRWTTLDRMRSGPRCTVRAQPAPEDVAYLQLTSGSTGEPRAVAISHSALAAGLQSIVERFDMTTTDVMATWTPLHTSPGLVRYVFGSIWFGCVSHLIRPSAFNLVPWLELLHATRATVTSAPDFAYRVLSRGRALPSVALGSLRLATSGGEPVRATSVRRFEERLGLSRVVQPAYGLSEATLIVTSPAPGTPLTVDGDGTVSCGTPMPGVEVKIVRRDGDPCECGEEGEILVRGASLFSGYFDDPTASAEALAGGWLHTGDAGTRDAAGRLYPRARVRALIKRAGSTIAPREIEECVEGLAGVAGAAAVDLEGREGAAEIVAIVIEVRVTAHESWPSLAARAQRTVLDALGFVPQPVVIVPDGTIPRAGNGKVRYADLRRSLASPDFLARAVFST